MFEFNFIKPKVRVIAAILFSICYGLCVGGFAVVIEETNSIRVFSSMILALVVLSAVYISFIIYVFITTVFEDKAEKN